MMKKILFLFFAAAFVFASCSDDDETALTPLSAPSVTGTGTTVSSLAFSWDAVPGASQYAYELKSPDGDVVLGGITSGTSLLATGLKDNTEYTLTVWAFAPGTSDVYTTSPVAVIKAVTGRIVPLATPDVDGMNSEQASGGIFITWPAVDNADYYIYRYDDGYGEKSGTVETNSVLLSGLSAGTYTVYITACSNDEAYGPSETISFTFECSIVWMPYSDLVTLSMTQKGVKYTIETKMEKAEGMNLYRIPDFLGSGLDFTFSTDEAYPDWDGYYLIEPYSNYWNDDEDASWMDAYWFYDTANDSWPEWESFGGNTITGLSIMREYYGYGYYSYISFDDGYGQIGVYATYYADGDSDAYNYVEFTWGPVD